MGLPRYANLYNHDKDQTILLNMEKKSEIPKTFTENSRYFYATEPTNAPMGHQKTDLIQIKRTQQ